MKNFVYDKHSGLFVLRNGYQETCVCPYLCLCVGAMLCVRMWGYVSVCVGRGGYVVCVCVCICGGGMRGYVSESVCGAMLSLLWGGAMLDFL